MEFGSVHFMPVLVHEGGAEFKIYLKYAIARRLHVSKYKYKEK